MASGSESRAAYWTRQLSRTKGKMKEGFQTIQPWAWTLKKIGGVLGFKSGLLGSECAFLGLTEGGDYPWAFGKRSGFCTPGLKDEG